MIWGVKWWLGVYRGRWSARSKVWKGISKVCSPSHITGESLRGVGIWQGKWRLDIVKIRGGWFHSTCMLSKAISHVNPKAGVYNTHVGRTANGYGSVTFRRNSMDHEVPLVDEPSLGIVLPNIFLSVLTFYGCNTSHNLFWFQIFTYAFISSFVIHIISLILNLKMLFIILCAFLLLKQSKTLKGPTLAPKVCLTVCHLKDASFSLHFHLV